MKVLKQIKKDQWRNRIYCGDSLALMEKLPSESINLIVTSPPYADQRKSNYFSVKPDKYVDWFLRFAAQMKRILTEDGSFILNIKESVANGERQDYVLRLILALKEQGWLWTEEYMWSKKNSFPGKWPNRFRDSWERCLHFTKAKKFAMYQETVMVPMGSWAKGRIKSDYESDEVRTKSPLGNAFSRKVKNWEGRDLAYPSNVLSFATECGNKQHSAAFPIELPTWFIKLFSKPGDIVLDPFMGSGTVAVAAKRLDRVFVGFELLDTYAQVAVDRLLDESSSEIQKQRQRARMAKKIATTSTAKAPARDTFFASA